MRFDFQGDVRNFFVSRITLQREHAPFNSDSSVYQGTNFSTSVLPVWVLRFVISWTVVLLLHRNTLLPFSNRTSPWYQHRTYVEGEKTPWPSMLRRNPASQCKLNAIMFFHKIWPTCQSAHQLDMTCKVKKSLTAKQAEVLVKITPTTVGVI